MKYKLEKSFNLSNSLFLLDIKGNIIGSDLLQKNQLSSLESIVKSFKKLEADELIETFLDDKNKAVKVYLWTIDFKAETFKSAAKLGKKLLSKKTSTITINLAKDKNLELKKFAEAVMLASYRFDHYRTKNESEKLEQISFYAIPQSDFDEAMKINDSVTIARNIGNLGGNDFTPTDFKNTANKLSKEHGFNFYALNKAELKKQGFGCFSAVAQGSDQEAYLNVMEYKTKGAKQTIMLVGKGLTLDTGGYSIKPAGGMEEMKFDMCGGAAVIGAMDLVGKFKPDVNVIGIIPSSENMINGSAYKPGDVVKAYNGMTVEINNTDAEGRLLLCDSLSYGLKKYKPDLVIDLATLTGAVVVALGHIYTGMYSTDKTIEAKMLKAAAKTNEDLWPMPLDDRYAEDMKSDYADIQNAGKTRWGGSCTAAIFLKAFMDNTPWVHLDIAGSAYDNSYIEQFPTKGSSGVGVRLLYQLIKDWQK